MKRLQAMLMALVMVVMLLAGCGSETNTVYVTSESGAKLSITGANTQQIQLAKNADGSLGDLDYGSLKVMPEDVDYYAYSSDKVGYYQDSRVKGHLSNSGLIKFEGMPNGDSGVFIAVLKNGDTCEVLLSRNVATYKPMYYSVSGSNWYTYGTDSNPFASIYAQGSTVYAYFNFGCDQLIGTMPYVSYQEGARIMFIDKAGLIYEGNVVQDPESGNLNGSLSFAITEPVNEYGQRKVEGKFYIVLPNGMSSELNFDWGQPSYAWYFYGGYNLSQSFNEETGNVTIAQYL